MWLIPFPLVSRKAEAADSRSPINTSPDSASFSLSGFDFYSFLSARCLWPQWGINPPASGTVPGAARGTMSYNHSQGRSRDKECVNPTLHGVHSTAREQEG